MSQQRQRGGPLIGSLKKLLLCRRRRKSGARQSPTSSTESSRQVFGSGAAVGCGGSDTGTADTPDWEQRCPPRPILGLAAKRYKRCWQQRAVSTEYRLLEPQEDTDSVRTLGSGSVEIADTEALIESLATPGLKPEIGQDDGAAAVTNVDEEEVVARGCGEPVGPEPEEADAASGCLASKSTRRGSFGGCRAEICLLENCDHCSKVKSSSGEAYVLAKPDDLVVTEYRVETCLSSNRKQSKVVNNAPLNYQRHMKAELCEVNLPVESSLHVRSAGEIHMSTNVSNVTLPCCSEANHGGAACQQHHQPLTVRAQSEESEPRNTCATVTASGQVSSCELADFNDASRPTYASATAAAEAITNAAAGATADCPRSRASLYGGEAEKKSAGMQSQRPQRRHNRGSTYDGAAAVEQTNSSFRQPDHLSKERFAALTGDQCSRLCQGLRTDRLLLQYLDKRDISQATRERHNQRCGRITAELMHRILRPASAAEAASASAAGPAAAAGSASMASAVACSGDAAAPPVAAASSAASGRRRATVPVATAAKTAVSVTTTVAAADRLQQCSSNHDSNSQHHRRRAHISACTWSLHGLP